MMTRSESEKWKPLSADKLGKIAGTFTSIYPSGEYGDLAAKITDYWIEKLHQVWNAKALRIKEKDSKYIPSDPLSRIRQNTVVIAYADSITRDGQEALVMLDSFLGEYFPSIRGMHILPACVVAEGRFNDGFFSQVVRDRIHAPFGTNRQFADMMEKYYSMADFVLNHVDIDNPEFRAYLDGDDEAGRCFYVFTEEEYQNHLKQGDFDRVFRPRPFPLFTIFRRRPRDEKFAKLSDREKIAEIKGHLKHPGLSEVVVAMLSIFNKIKNDQMLLDDDYRHVVDFRSYLEKETAINPDDIFEASAIQETGHIPYIFRAGISDRSEFLEACGMKPALAGDYARTYEKYDPIIFGEEIRALTTFSHVQVDLNTSTYEGLKMLADDFSWYLGMDLNMLRLDAANFAFKKWRTSCFGLDEANRLMKILYLSMDCVSPRTVANLEVNDQLGNILKQMADKKTPPPMMYDFHLAGMLPAVFNTGDVEILSRIFRMITKYDIPRESIRFSLVESHDGKSVRGSLDLLTLTERQGLADTVESNSGKIKYKSVPSGQYDTGEFQGLCRQAGVDYDSTASALFERKGGSEPILLLKANLRDESDIAAALGMDRSGSEGNRTLKYFVNKVIYGKEPYELCTSTIDSMTRLDDPNMEAERYLAFYTLAFSVMGRNVKSVYFNDLLGLPNDYERFNKSGEFRDIKRTKSDYDELESRLMNPASVQHKIARGMNNLIALVDSDPALGFRGNEAEVVFPTDAACPKPLAGIHNSCGSRHTLVVVNVGAKEETVTIDLGAYGLGGRGALFENIKGMDIAIEADGRMNLVFQPYGRLWLTREKVEIPFGLLK